MREVAEETQFCQARDGALGFKSSRGGVAQVSDIEFTGFPGRAVDTSTYKSMESSVSDV